MSFSRILVAFLFYSGSTVAFSVQSVTKMSSHTQNTILNLTGGGFEMEIVSRLTTMVEAGPYGVLGLAATSAMVLLPITQIKNLYAISLGYGLSIAAIGFFLKYAFAPDLLALPGLSVLALMAYGIRLFSFLLLRDLTWKRTSAVKNTPRLKRIPFSLSIAIFYALMTTPVMYALRVPTPDSIVTKVGTVLAWVGLLLESTADAQKYLAKRNSEKGTFVGPTSGVFALTRHPNYTGEVLFWLGIFVGGIPSLGKSIVGWTCSVLGFVGIFNIMKSAAKGLEKRQKEEYGSQEKYQKWTEQVKVPLLPFM